ncbi:hypothetical protein M405DRAFT_600723 [Rhizopogon salebrosus TDB-379]|nr:hypothetical protein M405DRAFT_600723 [Rhizopogon salebrosus TDB-379]
MHPSLISYPDRELLVTSLSCLLAYKSPHLWYHEEKSKDRHQLVDVIVRLLYGLMLEKKDCSRGGDRRAAVLTACLVALLVRMASSHCAKFPRWRKWRTKQMKRRAQSERYSFQCLAFCEP